MFVGLGIIREVEADPKSVGDMIPCDIVVANILVATAYNSQNNGLAIYNVGSSDRNPMCWVEMQKVIQDYWNNNVSQNRIAKSKVFVSRNKYALKAS
jgi:hypothetical protein